MKWQPAQLNVGSDGYLCSYRSPISWVRSGQLNKHAIVPLTRRLSGAAKQMVKDCDCRANADTKSEPKYEVQSLDLGRPSLATTRFETLGAKEGSLYVGRQSVFNEWRGLNRYAEAACRPARLCGMTFNSLVTPVAKHENNLAFLIPLSSVLIANSTAVGRIA